MHLYHAQIPEYFLRLPAELRNELAHAIGYLASPRGPSMLHEVRAFHHLDELSIIMICSHMKTMTFDKGAVHHVIQDVEHEHHIEKVDTIEREVCNTNTGGSAANTFLTTLPWPCAKECTSTRL